MCVWLGICWCGFVCVCVFVCVFVCVCVCKQSSLESREQQWGHAVCETQAELTAVLDVLDHVTLAHSHLEVELEAAKVDMQIAESEHQRKQQDLTSQVDSLQTQLTAAQACAMQLAEELARVRLELETTTAEALARDQMTARELAMSLETSAPVR